MPPPFEQVDLGEFTELVKQFPFTRTITVVHMHHTARPNHSQYQGHATIDAMWRAHLARGFSDIAQHVSIAPDGTVWLCRSWNASPASSSGSNGTAQAGPFMFETIGDFTIGADVLEGAQRTTVVQVIASVQRRFGLRPEDLKFHRNLNPTQCPGTGVEFADILEEVRAAHAEVLADPFGVVAMGSAERRASAPAPQLPDIARRWLVEVSSADEPDDTGCPLHDADGAAR